MIPRPQRIYRFGAFLLDPVERLLQRDGETISLQPKIFDLLLVLVESHGRLLGKDELMRRVWPDTIVHEGNLANNISILRKILNENGRQFVATVSKRGYRFIAPVEQSWERWDAPEIAENLWADGGPKATPCATPPDELIGRETELARLQKLLDLALSGERQVVFVTGEPGIGKTGLVKTFLQRVQAKGRTLIAHGQCLEHHGTGEAYLPMLEALNRLCREPGRGPLIELLARCAPTWLVQMPALIDIAERAALRSEVFGATRERMLREMAETIEQLTARAPLVLVIEDMHWSDYSTLDLVSALALRHEPARLLLIGTWRPVEVNLSGHPLKAVKQDLQMRRRCTEMALELLPVDAVGKYLAARYPQNCFPEELAHLIHQRSDGNPLFVINLVDYLLARGLILELDGRQRLKDKLTQIEVGVPESIRQMIERQIDRLGSEEQRLLEAASIAGAVFSSVEAAAALGCDVLQIEDHCQRLARQHQFLQTIVAAGEASASFGFIHALYQNVFYERTPLSRRSQLHRRIGECKESAYGPGASEIAAELAMHFEQGRDYRKAGLYLRQAAENALRRYANREANDHLIHALELIDRLPQSEQLTLRLTMLEWLGNVRRSINDMHGAVEAYEAMVACARKSGRLESEVRALHFLGLGFFTLADAGRTLAFLDQLDSLSRGLQDKRLRAYTRGLYGYLNLHVANLQSRGWRNDDFLALAPAAEAAREAGDRALQVEYLGQIACHQVSRSEYKQAYSAAEEGMRLAEEIGGAFHFMACQYYRAWALFCLGEWGETLSTIRAGLESAEKNCHLSAIGAFQLALAWLHLEAGDFDRSRELCESVLSKQSGDKFGRYVGKTLLGFAHLGLKQFDPAFKRFNETATEIEQSIGVGHWIFFLMLHHGLSLYWFKLREFEKARNKAEQLCQLAAQSGERAYLALGRRTLAEIALAERDYERVERELSFAFGALQQYDIPMAEWRVRQTAARLHAANRRPAMADREYAHSRAILHRLADSLGANEPFRDQLQRYASLQTVESSLDFCL